MNGNDFMAWVLRSPLHGMLSGNTLLITFTGRKTGKRYTTPINFYREGEYLWAVSSRDRTWWRNLQGGAPVDLLLKRKFMQAFAETEMDGDAVSRGCRNICGASRWPPNQWACAWKMGWPTRRTLPSLPARGCSCGSGFEDRLVNVANIV